MAASSVPKFRQREAFHSCCCQLLAHTISSVPSAAVKIQSPPDRRFIRYLQTLGLHGCASSPPSGYLYRQAHWRNGGGAGIRTPVQTVYLTGSLIVCCRSGRNWTHIKGFGDLYSTVKLHSYIARFPIQPAPKATYRFIYLIKHGLDILMSSRREPDSNRRPTSRRVKD